MLLFLHAPGKTVWGSACLLFPLLLSWNMAFLWHFMCFELKALSSQLWSDDNPPFLLQPLCSPPLPQYFLFANPPSPQNT